MSNNTIPNVILDHLIKTTPWVASKSFKVSEMRTSHIEGTLEYLNPKTKLASLDLDTWKAIFQRELELRKEQERVNALVVEQARLAKEAEQARKAKEDELNKLINKADDLKEQLAAINKQIAEFS